MDISKKKMLIVLLISALWIACIFLGSTGHFLIGMVLCVPLIALHLILGAAKNGIVSKKFLRYPLAIWVALSITGFILNGYYAGLFAGVMPSFTVFGLHPSFAPTIFTYWLGGLFTLSLGFYLVKDEWLTQQEWDAFCQKAHEIEGVK